MTHATTIEIFKPLLTEVFKMKNGLAPPIMKSVLNKRINTYNLRNFQEFATERKDCLVLKNSVTITLNSGRFC